MRVEDLETPVPVVDLDILESNIDSMQSYCDRHGLKLRPHIKTHKCPEIALMQIARGAVGITCQKLTEAEVMADAGIDDILLSYPLVGVGKRERLAALAKRVWMSVTVDSEATLQTAIQAASPDAKIKVLVDFDSGARRTGVQTPEAAALLAQRIAGEQNLEFGGLFTYPLLPASIDFVDLAGALMEVKAFSAANTPTYKSAHETRGLTEVRHGTYVFHDRSTVAVGAATHEECALHIWATVVSRPTQDRAILDSGSKTLSSDRIPEEQGLGYGTIREYPEAIVERLYEEHALVHVPDGCTGLMIGERVRVLPNHVCVSVNLHDEIPAARKGFVEKRFAIAARGKTR